MQSITAELKARNTEILVVSADTVEENRRLVKKQKFDFKLLSDTDLSVIDSFGLRHEKGGYKGNDIARPAVYIADKEGNITWRHLTDNWRVRVRPETILENTVGFD